MRIRYCATLVAVSAVLLVGCGAPVPSGGLASGDTSAPGSVASETVSNVTGPDHRRIVLTVTGHGALVAPVERIEDLASDTRTRGVAFGRVSAVEDFCASESGYRLLTIEVSSAVKGEQLETIRVVEDGGIVHASCLAPVVDGKFGESVKFGPDDYVDFEVEGHPHTPVGAEVIVFIGPSNQDRYGATHQLVDGIQGLLVKSDDLYVRSVFLDIPGVESSIPERDAELRLSNAARR